MSIKNIPQLIDSYKEFYSGEVRLYKEAITEKGELYELHLPIFYHTGEGLSFYLVIDKEGNLIMSDTGYTLSNLRMCGADLSLYQNAIKEITKSYNVQYNQEDQELFCEVLLDKNVENYNYIIQNFINCLLLVDALAFSHCKVIIDNLIIPRTWEEFKIFSWQLKFSEGPFRLEYDQKHYKNYLTSKSIEEHVQHLFSLLEDKDVNLVDNIFGYTKYLQYLPQIKHKMVLSKKELTPAQIDDYLMNTCGLHPKDYDWFENSTHKKTRPEIFHVHVFVNTSLREKSLN